MRFLILAGVLALTACTVETTTSHTDGDGGSPGYTLELIANNDSHTYRITAPDGRVAAAQASNEASMMVPAAQVQALFDAAPPPPTAEESNVSIRVPGLDLRVKGDEGDEEHARVAMRIAGADIAIDARDNGEGPDEGNATIRLSGADAESARDFINDAEGLSESVKAQLRTEVGL